MSEEREREGERALLRPVETADLDFLFKIANDPRIRANSFHSESIPWEQHCQWFAERLRSGDPFFIIMQNHLPCGSVRFAIEGGEALLSIAIDPSWHNQGLGTRAVREACRRVLAETPAHRIVAWVKAGNPASLRLFMKSHFRQEETATQHGSPAIRCVYPPYEE